MSEEIIKVLDNLGEKFGIAIDWSSQNILPYLQDLMNRIAIANTIECGLVVIGGIICLIISICIFKWGQKQKNDENKYNWEWTDEGLAGFWAIIILLFIAGLFIIGGIIGVIEGIFLPEVTVINYLTNIGG